MKHRRRKIITRAIVFLLLGAIVNVAVAWASANRPSLHSFTQEPIGTREARLLKASGETASGNVSVLTGFGCEQRNILLEDPLAFQRMRETQERFFERGRIACFSPRVSCVDLRLAGWPTLSLSGEIWIHSITYCEKHGLNEQSQSGQVLHGILMSDHPPITHYVYPPAVHVLPYAPIWPGFAINTIFYAAILWLLFAAPFALRQRRRIKRGLCPACAYPIGSSDNCTECGKPVITCAS